MRTTSVYLHTYILAQISYFTLWWSCQVGYTVEFTWWHLIYSVFHEWIFESMSSHKSSSTNRICRQILNRSVITVFQWGRWWLMRPEHDNKTVSLHQWLALCLQLQNVPFSHHWHAYSFILASVIFTANETPLSWNVALTSCLVVKWNKHGQRPVFSTWRLGNRQQIVAALLTLNNVATVCYLLMIRN